MANCLNSLPSRDQWPVGFRFYPTDEELIDHYLKNKVLRNEYLVAYIRHIDVCKHEPSDLPRLLNDHAGINKWFFFSALDFKNSNDNRSNRITNTGFWKSTGNDRKIMARETNKLIGTKKTLVFHRGRGREANRTNWVIHEYRLHKDTSKRPFVICRLKKKSDMKVSKFDEPPNGLVNSTFGNVCTPNGIQESALWHSTGQPALPDSQSDGGVNWQSRQPDATEQYFNLLNLLNQCSSPPQPALPDFQSINASDGGVNRGSILPEATENYFTVSELLNSDDQPMDASDECLDDATTSKPRSEDFQSANGIDGEFDPIDFLDYFVEDANYDGEVNNRQLRPGASECEFNDCLNYIRESENCDEVTSRICNDNDSDAAIVWQNNSIPPSCFHNYTSSSMQNMPTIKEPGRRGKFLHYAVFNGCAPKIVRIPSKEIFQDKAKKYEKRMEVVSSPRLSIADSSDELKSEAGSKATGSIVSTRNVFSHIITSKRIQHKSIHPLVYVAKTFLGIIMFVVLAQEVLRCRHWC